MDSDRGEEESATVADLLPRNAEEFHYEVEQALRGIPCSDRRVTYHYVMKEMGWSWLTLMKTPYEVVIRTATILSIEGMMKDYMQKKAQEAER